MTYAVVCNDSMLNSVEMLLVMPEFSNNKTSGGVTW
jgi:hypothetical protein